MTRAVSLVGWTRSSISVLTESMASAHEPLTSPSVGALGELALLADDAAWRSSSLASAWPAR